MQFNNSFATPTISSVNQLNQAPAHLREQIKKLSVVVDQLKVNIENEDVVIENIEKSHQKNFENIGNQINTLRKAINTLADVVMDEIENTKTEFRDSLDMNCNGLKNLFEQVSMKVTQMQNSRANELFEIQNNSDTQYNQVFQNLQSLKTDVITILDEEKTEQQLITEQLKIMINNNSNRIQLLSKDKLNLQNSINELKSQLNSNSQQYQINLKELKNIDETYKFQLAQMNKKFGEMKTNQNNSRELILSELQETLKDHEQILNDYSEQINQNNESGIQKIKDVSSKIDDVERKYAKNFIEVNGNLQQISKAYQESSNHIITEFQNTVFKSSNEVKMLIKKINTIETSLNTTRDEINSMINNSQYNSMRKYEECLRAISDISLNAPILINQQNNQN